MQRRTKLFQSRAQAPLKIDVRSMGPQSLPQLFPGHDLPVLQQEQGENSKGLFLELDPHSLASHYSSGEIHLEEAKSYRNVRMDSCFRQRNAPKFRNGLYHVLASVEKR